MSPRNSNSDALRWAALIAPYLAASMVVIDATIVYVALPSIQSDLHFSATSLLWVANGYLITYGGFLLLCGRLGDRYGHQRIFLFGVALFTLASLGCALAKDPPQLIGTRAAQGLGSAAILATALPLVVKQFADVRRRTRAVGVYSCVSAAGGSAGVLLGGVLTSGLSWRAIFLVNLPMGILAYVMCLKLRPAREDHVRENGRLDVGGAVSITTTMTLAVYSVLSAARTSVLSTSTVLSSSAALASLVVFVIVESRVKAPIVPLSLFQLRSLTTSVVIGALWAASHASWTFICALYMQLVLGYDALQAGLAFLPATVLMATLSVGVSRALILRFGATRPLNAGLAAVTCGLALLARAPVGAGFILDLLPGMLLFGLGWGIAYNAFVLVALSEVSERNYGVASGAVNSASVMGSTLALALVVGLATSRANHLIGAGQSATVAASSGYHLGFGVAATLAGIATLLSTTLAGPRRNAATSASLSR